MDMPENFGNLLVLFYEEGWTNNSNVDLDTGVGYALFTCSPQEFEEVYACFSTELNKYFDDKADAESRLPGGYIVRFQCNEDSEGHTATGYLAWHTSDGEQALAVRWANNNFHDLARGGNLAGWVEK